MFFSDPAHWDRIHIVHCGVKPDRYAGGTPAPRQGGECRLLFVGRLAPVKGLRLLIEAMRRLADDISSLRLVVVGDGPDRRILEDLARPLGDKVRFTGYLSQAEVAGTMQEADIVVLPSFAEGVPVVLMEAFAGSRPVIATQVAGVGELVENGTSGLLVPPGDVESLTRAIQTLAADPDLQSAMGARGRARVEAEFDIDIEAARLAALFAGRKGGIRPDPLP
jgi:glycosyltransferase involved in cell wall biosynthesis